MGLWKSFKSFLKVGDYTNYSEFENDGTLKANGSATTWDDISFPATLVKRGSNNLPDFDFVNNGLLFPQNKTDEIVYIVGQMSHSKKMGSPINLHIHFIQTSGTLLPVFKMKYRFYNNGESPGDFSSDIACKTVTAMPYTSGSIMNIIEFDDIPAPTGETVSANIDIQLWRDDNVALGDVLVKYIDIHYEKDTIGSRTILTK